MKLYRHLKSSKLLIKQNGLWNTYCLGGSKVSGAKLRCTIGASVRCFSSDDDDKPSVAGGYRSPWKLMKQEMQHVGAPRDIDDILPIPRESDILVIGGGAVGLAVAYWLKQRHPTGFTLTVVEKDPQYTTCSTTRAVGGIRQQFSLKENIEMSLFSASFLKDLSHKLKVVDMDPPDIHFTPQGYLFCAREEQAAKLAYNHSTQTECGAKVDLMDKDLLKARYPWLNCEDLALASYGVQNEGWFDPWLLLAALKAKCLALGTKIVKGELVEFKMADAASLPITVDGKVVRKQAIEHAMIRAPDGKTYPLKPAMTINCAGCWAQEVGLMAGIGNGNGALQVAIPVEKRKRLVFTFHCPDGPGLDMPMIVDPSGVYVKREGLGGHYVCGVSPQSDADEPPTDTLEVTESDYKVFYERIWPVLADRIPAFQNLKVTCAWAGFYDYNTMDQNLIIGNHPYHRNFFIATGSSGHGLQHSLAIGRAMMELIIDDEYQTIDLSKFSFDRVMYDEPVFEDNIV